MRNIWAIKDPAEREDAALEWARRVFPHLHERAYWNRLKEGYAAVPLGVPEKLGLALKALDREEGR